MGIINVLDFSVANLIAAGEVVDRPASVVKELLENSVDAGARHITVEIKNGGASLIRVADDGCGMGREDVPVCILRHATSKIKDADDLDGIATLGFRGEALAAIAAVSKLRVMTKRREDASGTLLACENGNVVSISEVGCRAGTTMLVEDLFAAVPARRKFLKRDASEAMAVAAVAEKIALSKPEIAIKFISDGGVRFDTAGDGKLINAVYAVLGRDFAKKLLPVRGLTEGVSVSGYVGSPDNVRGSRSCQNFFLNGRYIKSGTITAALEDAYNSYIPPERFPCCVLNVDVHPATVDVNVHPTKLEVKFSNEKIIYGGVYSAVRNALSERVRRPELRLRPNLTGEDVRVVNAFAPVSDRVSEEAEAEKNAPASAKKQTELKLPFDLSPQKETFKPDVYVYKEAEPKIKNSAPDAEKQNDAPPPPAEGPPEPALPFYRMIGVAFNGYIIAELEDRVLIIDKHAAHERIIFEEMKRNMKRGSRYSQLVLIPLQVKLSGAELEALGAYKAEAEATGVEFEPLSDGVQITAVPAGLEADAAASLVAELAARLSDGTGGAETRSGEAFEKALYQASCKAALKAGRRDTDADNRWICEKVLALPDIKYCPHGRPVAYELTKSELERQFGRT